MKVKILYHVVVLLIHQKYKMIFELQYHGEIYSNNNTWNETWKSILYKIYISKVMSVKMSEHGVISNNDWQMWSE